jgi:hypothetical protein
MWVLFGGLVGHSPLWFDVGDMLTCCVLVGGDLRSGLMPTFQNILQTIAPPISQHERLQVHITHDFTNYPTLDPLIYQVFSRVMSQVEGGDLMVVQKGQEATARRGSGDRSRDFGSWHDGPWWRSGEQRSINAVKGIIEGSKLARASAESYASDHMAGRGGVEEVAKKATETLNTSNPTRDSEIFLAIQAISQTRPDGLFAGSSAKEEESQIKESPDHKYSEEVLFAIYLHDPIHGIALQALSQAVPAQWLEWLDAPSGGEGTLPESIEEIVGSGGVDPREWVSEWVEETLTLAIGVVAQRYVAKRMGVGEGGARKGKEILRPNAGQEDVIEAGGGEASRAVAGL